MVRMAVSRSIPTNVHQHANTALDKFRVLHVHVDHQVVVTHSRAASWPRWVIMFRIIFCAVEAFMRVEPESTSGTNFGDDGRV